MKIIIIILMFWATNSYGRVCTASPTNNDQGVIGPCFAKLLSHFEEILKQQLTYNYADHLKDNRSKLNDSKFRRKYYGHLFNELEQIQRLKHRHDYPDPRPAVRCEAPSGNSE